MRGCWPAEQIRAAERQLMARLPDGALMARAAHAVAVQAGATARASATAPGCCCWSVRATTAATRCSPAPSWPGAGCRCGRCWPTRTGRTPGVWRRCAAAGGRVVPLAAAVARRPDRRRPGRASAPADRCARRCCRWSGTPPPAAAPVLAVDLPSGVDPDTGAVAGPAIHATRHRLHGRATSRACWWGRAGCTPASIRLVPLGLHAELPEPDCLVLDDERRGRRGPAARAVR